MIGLLQRVSRGEVTIAGECVGTIGRGLVVLVGSAREEVLNNLRHRESQNFLVAFVATLCILTAAAALIHLVGGQRRLIDRLARNEARFQATFEQAAVGICEVAPDARLLRVNRRLAQMLGYDEEEMPGRSWATLLDEMSRLTAVRLFEEVRTKRNLSYAVQAGLSQRRTNYGLLYVTAVQPDTTLKVMLAEVEKLKNEPITAQRLAATVNGFLTEYWLAQETNMGQATTLGTYELVGGGWENAETFTDRVRAVTPADIQRVAREYLKNVNFAVIGNPSAINGQLFTSY